MQQYPHQQAFDKENAIAAMNERRANNAIIPRNLARRQKDYALFHPQLKNNAFGFHKPGSNKK